MTEQEQMKWFIRMAPWLLVGLVYVRLILQGALGPFGGEERALHRTALLWCCSLGMLLLGGLYEWFMW
jgi:hypothetical protein